MGENTKIWKTNYNVLGKNNPKKITEDVCKKLSDLTEKRVYAEICEVTENIKSMYSMTTLAEKMNFLNKEIKTSPKDKLGEIDDKTIKTYSVVIKSPQYPNYKYRMFFMEFNFTFYPVKFALDEAISKELGYNEIITAKNEDEFEMILGNIITSDKVTSIIEGLLTAISINKNE